MKRDRSVAKFWSTFLAETRSPVLVPLLAIDVVLAGLHFGYRLSNRGVISSFNHQRYSLETDRGIGEVIFYGVWVVIIACVIVLWRRDRSPILGVWSVGFAFLLADDSFSFHERAGLRLGESLVDSSVIGLKPNDLGEIGFLFFVGVTLLFGLFVTYRSASDYARRFTRRIMFFVGALAIFGVFVDALHAATLNLLPASGLSMIEDGGELLVLTFLCSYVVRQTYPRSQVR